MKKAIATLVALVVLMTQLTSLAYPVSADLSTDSNVSSTVTNPYEKIHVYTFQDDQNEYSTINNASELSTAIQALKTYATNSTALQNVDSDIRITVEFESHFSETEEFISFRNQLDEAKSITEVREIRKSLNSFSKKYHTALVKANISLLNALEYDSIDEIGYSPFVILETTQDTVRADSLVDLAGNNSVMNISLEPNNSFEENVVDTEVLSNAEINATTSTAYGNEVTYSWDQMLECIGAKSIVDASVYQGEGIVIGVLDSGICDVTNENLVGKDVTVISNSGTIDDHATTVTSVIARIAPEAKIIYTNGSLTESLEDLIDNYCDVINVSRAGGRSAYLPSIDGIYDYQIYNHSIVVVKSSGNNGASIYPVTSPGKGYNVLVVGGVTGTDSGNVIYDSGASCNMTGGHIKPNICGVFNFYIPGTDHSNISSSCTSFAAPQIAACVALILEFYLSVDDTWLYPEEIISMVMCSATKTDDYGVASAANSDFDLRVGAGIFNLSNCLDSATIVDSLFVNSAVAGEEVYSKTVRLSAGQKIRVSLSLCVPAVLNSDSSAANPIDFTNFDIYLIPMLSDTAVASSTLSDVTNNELFCYTATSIDRYRIVIKAQEGMDSSELAHYLGISYTIYE